MPSGTPSGPSEWFLFGKRLGTDRIQDRSTDPYPNIMENRTSHARGPVQTSVPLHTWMLEEFSVHYK